VLSWQIRIKCWIGDG